jgi:Flp pilus assembly protein TadD
MRRLHISRAGMGESDALEGVEGFPLEGDVVGTPSDEGPALTPYAAECGGTSAATRAGDTSAVESRGLRRALELEGLGRRLDAITVLRQLVAEGLEELESRRHLARLLEATGDADEALEVLSAGLTRHGASVGLLADRGALLGRLSRHVDAERDLRQALAQAPEDTAVHVQLGVALLRRGRIAEAVAHLRRATLLAPDDAEAAFHLGEALYHRGEFEGALGALERAAALRTHDPRAYALLGRLLDRLGRTEEAMAMHRKARDATVR